MGSAASIGSADESSSHHHTSAPSTYRREKGEGAVEHRASAKKVHSLKKPDLDPETKEFLVQCFKNFVFLKKELLDNLRIALILEVVMHRLCVEGEVLMAENEPGEEMYIIEGGDLSVSIKGDVVRHLRRGATVGELSLLYNEPRSATVTCLTACSLFVLHRNDFLKIQEAAVSATAAKRAVWIKNCPELRSLGPLENARLISTLEFVEYKKGDVIYEKDALTNRVVIIEEGEARFEGPPTTESTKNIPSELVASPKASPLKRKYMARSKSRFEDADIVKSFTENLYDDITVNPEEEFEKNVESSEFLPKISGSYSDDNPFGDEDVVNAGCVIGIDVLLCKAGMQSTDDWVWSSSTTAADAILTITPAQALDASDATEIVEETVKPLSEGARCPFRLVVTSDFAQCSFFTVANFENIFGDASTVLPQLRHAAENNKTYVIHQIHKYPRSNSAFESFDPDKFEQISLLAQGKFGFVSIASYDDGPNYFLSRFSKALIAEAGRVERLKKELQMLAEMEHVYITKLVGVFQKPDEITFIMEAGGSFDLWSYIYEMTHPENNGVPMVAVQYFLSCITCALAHMHHLGIVYRDLKPENIRLSDRGRITLFEFSNAKKIPFITVLPNGHIKINTKSFTFCGTPEYLAPEYIFNAGVDHAVDIWALGIVAYEMIELSTPFASTGSADSTKILSNIAACAKNGFKCPSALVKKTKGTHFTELLGQLLKPVSVGRLSYSERNTIRILRHSFFNGIEVEAIKSGQYKPSDLLNLSTRRYFDDSSASLSGDSYKRYSPIIKAYTGPQDVWSSFESIIYN